LFGGDLTKTSISGSTPKLDDDVTFGESRRLLSAEN